MAIADDSSTRCFDPSRGWLGYDFAIYACIVVFVAVYLAMLPVLFIARRKARAGKHLLGLPFTFAVIFMLIDQVVNFLGTTLQACRVTRGIESFYDWSIAGIVFTGLNTLLLLFVVIYTLNSMLREQLGHNPSTLKAIFGLILFVLGGLELSIVALRSYIWWKFGHGYRGYPFTISIYVPEYVSLAFDATFLVSVLGSGALSILAARSIKKKDHGSNSLTAWISVLILSLVSLNIVSIVQTAGAIAYNTPFTVTGIVVMFWLMSISRAMAFVSIIIIAKNSAWKFKMVDPHTINQPFAVYQRDPAAHGGLGHHA